MVSMLGRLFQGYGQRRQLLPGVTTVPDRMYEIML